MNEAATGAGPAWRRISVTHLPLDLGRSASEALGAGELSIGVPMVSSDAGPRPVADLTAADVETLIGTPTGDRFRSPDAAMFELQGFTAKPGEVMTVLRGPGEPVVCYLGLGEAEKIGLEELRRACAAFVRAAGRAGTALVLLPAGLAERASAGITAGPEGQRRAAQAVAEAAVLGVYKFSSHKSAKERGFPERVVVGGLGLDAESLEKGVGRGARLARAVCEARDLVNEPPTSMNPGRLAEVAREMVGSAARTTIEIWDEQRIRSERLGGLLGVARGSAEPPRLIKIDYAPAETHEKETHEKETAPHVVLVGKGITFDSGGLSLKTSEGMVTMKTDMSGAATVIATVCACADLGVPVRVSAIAPVTENMPGGRATKPGDVLVARDGQTIEVLNTDAEGRLILADGLSLAAEMEPDAIIDLATLTGAAVVALGTSIAGIFGNDEALVGRVLAAGRAAGEEMWPLPLPEDYRSHIDSEVADMKNVGKAGQAGAIAAAMLLKQFVHEVPWVHIDMAGPARSDEDRGVLSTGGTGFGVRTLLELLGSTGPA